MYTSMYMYGISFRFLANIAPPARHRIPRHFGFIFFFSRGAHKFCSVCGMSVPLTFPRQPFAVEYGAWCWWWMVDGSRQPKTRKICQRHFSLSLEESPFAAAPSQHVVLFYATKYAKARVNWFKHGDKDVAASIRMLMWVRGPWWMLHGAAGGGG